MIYDNNKVAIIACVNNEDIYKESLLYIEQLNVPENMQIELIEVQHAVSMAAGYQEAMESSDAKYKIYMHQDCFPCNKNLLHDIIALFKKDKAVGAIGVAGSGNLNPEKPVWWDSKNKYYKIYTKEADEFIKLDEFGEINGEYISVAAVDGLFIATQYDIAWRSDLFDGWHFYDISQTREFINAGYDVIIPRQEKPWVIHFTGRKIVDASYKKYMNIFYEHYCTQCIGEDK